MQLQSTWGSKDAQNTVNKGRNPIEQKKCCTFVMSSIQKKVERRMYTWRRGCAILLRWPINMLRRPLQLQPAPPATLETGRELDVTLLKKIAWNVLNKV